MRHRFAAQFGSCLMAVAAIFASANLVSAQEKPSMTVVLPSLDDFYADLKLIFSLVGEKGDEKSYNTLKDTIDTFLDGIDTTKAGGARIYSTPEGLQNVLSVPVKKDDDFKKLLLSYWDMDVKTAPPPEPKLIRQIPPAVTTRQQRAKMEKNERLIFKLFDGFLRYEPGMVSVAPKLETVRLAKGPFAPDLIAMKKLVAVIDGTAQTAEKRKQGFAVAKKEMLAGVVKGENESDEAFASRKIATEYQVAELERFFVESSKITAVWSVDHEQKEAGLNVDLVGLAGTSLETSVDLLDSTPDAFAGVSKGDNIFSLGINFPLDALREEALKSSIAVHRDSLKKTLSSQEKLSPEEKAVYGDLVDLLVEIVDGTLQLKVVNGFLRTSKDAEGNFTTTAGGGLPPESKAKIEQLLTTLAGRNPANKLESKIHVEEGVEIHKITIPKLAEEIPEFIGKEGEIFVGLGEKSAWLAAGNGSLELLKKSIAEAKAAGPKNGLAIDLDVKMGPYIEFLNAYYARHPAAAPQRREPAAKPRAGAAKGRPVPTSSYVAEEDLRKIALDVFKLGKDSLHLTLGRDGKTAQMRLRLEEGLLRFAGTTAAKVVKEYFDD